NGQWQPVIDDADADVEKVRRVILCSGKFAVDLLSNKQRDENDAIAIVRVEQLYPFPMDVLHPILERYVNAEDVVWAQEEPENMGAWEFARPLLIALLGKLSQAQQGQRKLLHYLGRPRSSSPAEGSSATHNFNQSALIEQAFSREIRDTADI